MVARGYVPLVGTFGRLARGGPVVVVGGHSTVPIVKDGQSRILVVLRNATFCLVLDVVDGVGAGVRTAVKMAVSGWIERFPRLGKTVHSTFFCQSRPEPQHLTNSRLADTKQPGCVL